MYRYVIIVEKTGSGFSAYCPDLPGCVAAGASEEDTISEMKKAIRFHIEGLQLENLPVPEASTTAVPVEI